jgi:hypothetical protein
MRIWKGLAILLTMLMMPMLGGCASRIAGNLAGGILNQNDPEMVRDGAPAYLLMVDGLIHGDPKDAALLRGGASLYSVYASLFVEDPERSRLLADRARQYGERALCASRSTACGLAGLPYEAFGNGLQELRRRDGPSVYVFVVSWLVWLKAHSDDWGALIDLPKVEKTLERLIELDEEYERGSAHLYLGIMKTIRPPALGGRPEEGRRHFERALELSGGQDLSVKVEYARYYARLMYDRELHDQLLQEVMAADATAPGLTLTNTLAKRQAKVLLTSAEDYF